MLGGKKIHSGLLAKWYARAHTTGLEITCNTQGDTPSIVMNMSDINHPFSLPPSPPTTLSLRHLLGAQQLHAPVFKLLLELLFTIKFYDFLFYVFCYILHESRLRAMSWKFCDETTVRDEFISDE